MTPLKSSFKRRAKQLGILWVAYHTAEENRLKVNDFKFKNQCKNVPVIVVIISFLFNYYYYYYYYYCCCMWVSLFSYFLADHTLKLMVYIDLVFSVPSRFLSRYRLSGIRYLYCYSIPFQAFSWYYIWI